MKASEAKQCTDLKWLKKTKQSQPTPTLIINVVPIVSSKTITDMEKTEQQQ